MNMYGVSNGAERRAGIHDVNVHVNELSALGCQDRGPQYPVGPCIGDNFDEASRLADLVGLTVLGHVKSGDFDVCARGPSLFFGHSHAAKLRIDKDSIGYYAIGGPGAVAGKLRHQNSIIIPG